MSFILCISPFQSLDVNFDLTCRRLLCIPNNISWNGICIIALSWHPNFSTTSVLSLYLQIVQIAAIPSVIEFKQQKYWKALRRSLCSLVAFAGSGQQQGSVRYILRKAIALSNVSLYSMIIRYCSRLVREIYSRLAWIYSPSRYRRGNFSSCT